MTDIVREAELAAHAGTIQWCRYADKGANNYLAGYRAGVSWLRTRPPREEAAYLAVVYVETRPGGTYDQATAWVDADRIPHFIAHIPAMGLHPEVFEVEDGAALKAQYVDAYGPHLLDTFFPPARTIGWPALNRLYEGVGAACWHAIED